MVIVLVQNQQVSTILPILAQNENTPNILFLGNNVAGSKTLVQDLGERVLMGFVRIGGYREKHVIITNMDSPGPITIGELDGSVSPRLQQIAATFQKAGFAIPMSSNIQAWLRTHYVEVGPTALAIYLAGGDTHRLAKTPDGVVLMVRGIREGYQVLQALGDPITPASHEIVFGWIPEPILVKIVQRVVDTKRAELEMAGHANAARDEMQHLANEFKTLAQTTSVPTPALDRLRAYLDPTMSPLPEMRAKLSPSWW